MNPTPYTMKWVGGTVVRPEKCVRGQQNLSRGAGNVIAS